MAFTIVSKERKFWMKVKAVRLHGAYDLRLDEFELPKITDDEILVKVISDTICMSTYKCSILGAKHKRVHDDVADHPAIIGHEFSGDIVEVGKNHRNRFRPGMKFVIQPNLNFHGTMWAPGYSYEFLGGDATYCIVPAEVMEAGCLLEYNGRAYYEASLAEPMSCSIGAVNAMYHTKMGDYTHSMGIKRNGKLAIVGGTGPMGLGALIYILNRNDRPSLVVIIGLGKERLLRARTLFPPDEIFKKNGVKLYFVSTADYDDPKKALLKISGGSGYDDVLCYTPNASLVTLSDTILGQDGCLNFFAGSTDNKFEATINFYNVHYNSTHIMGTTGGNISDMLESLRLLESGKINPAVMITHIGGLDATIDTTLNLPKIPGGKKLIYTHLSMPLTALSDLRKKGEEENDSRFIALGDIVDAHKGLWTPEAEEYLLTNFSESY